MTKKKLTKAAIKKYVDGGGLLCPYCGSNDISADGLEGDGPRAWSNTQCGKCHNEWVDLLELVDVAETDRQVREHRRLPL